MGSVIPGVSSLGLGLLFVFLQKRRRAELLLLFRRGFVWGLVAALVADGIVGGNGLLPVYVGWGVVWLARGGVVVWLARGGVFCREGGGVRGVVWGQVGEGLS